MPEIRIVEGVQSKLDSQIAKLREYRQTLISAAVTGQIDVRALANSQVAA